MIPRAKSKALTNVLSWARQAHARWRMPLLLSQLMRLAVLALALTLVLAGCDNPSVVRPNAHPSNTGATIPVQPTASASSSAFPAFSDWRVAYLDSNRHVHAVTLDGATDLVGATLPRFRIQGLQIANAVVSPDGHLLAYDATDLKFVNMTQAGPGAMRDVVTRVVYRMFWSPDGRWLALSDNSGGIALAQATGGAVVAIPGVPMYGDEGTPIPRLGTPSLWGWLDASHLAVGGYPLSGGTESTTAYTLSSLDIASGTLRTIATINSSGLGAPRLALAPDGSRALFSNALARNYPFTPIVDAIDIATGSVTPLPSIVRATSGTFGPEYTSATWRPGTHQVAVSTGFLLNNNLKVWLLDLDRDTAAPVINGQYVAGWTPDGYTLVVCTSNVSLTDDGPHDVSAVTFGPDGQPKVILLTHDANTFPFMGFVRTA